MPALPWRRERWPKVRSSAEASRSSACAGSRGATRAGSAATGRRRCAATGRTRRRPFARRQRQDRGQAVPSPSRIPTLRKYVATWRKAGAGAYKLRERTFRDYLDLLERHVLTPLGDARLDTLRAVRIEAELVAPLRDRGHLRTARLAVCALSRDAFGREGPDARTRREPVRGGRDRA